MNEDPAIEVSTLSQEVTKNGQSVEVEIYRLEGASEWSLSSCLSYEHHSLV